MKKRIVSLLMILVLSLSFVLTGCAGGEGAAAAESSGVDQNVKVGFIYNCPKNDGGWGATHEAGRLYLEEQLGVQTMFKESVPETQEVEKVARDMIDAGCNVIFATSFGFMDYIENISKEFPDVKFFHCSGFKTTENMSNYFGRIEDARYLTGIVAGLATKTNQIGYVAAFEIPEVVRGINAFTLGVKSVNPDAKVKVTWTHVWNDPAKEKEAANALIDGGADVIAQHQNSAGAQQAAEEKGVFGIGYHADMSPAAPNASLTSAVWNWGPYYVEAVKSVMDGTYQSGAYWEGLQAGTVDIAPISDKAPAEAKEQVEVVKQQILDGTFNVFQGPIKNQQGEIVVPEGSILSDEDQLGCDWFVEGVDGEIKK